MTVIFGCERLDGELIFIRRDEGVNCDYDVFNLLSNGREMEINVKVYDSDREIESPISTQITFLNELLAPA